MDASKRKGLRDAYKAQAMVGGVYRITCGGNRRSWLKATKNIAGQQNKFAFALAVPSCPEPGMRSEWLQYGPGSFSFTVLETLAQKETQTEAEFADDLALLLALWQEKEAQAV